MLRPGSGAAKNRGLYSIGEVSYVKFCASWFMELESELARDVELLRAVGVALAVGPFEPVTLPPKANQSESNARTPSKIAAISLFRSDFEFVVTATIAIYAPFL